MINIDKLTRAHGDFVLIDDVSFSIDKDGSRRRLLGYNGAAKTTIMKMICGCEFINVYSGNRWLK